MRIACKILFGGILAVAVMWPFPESIIAVGRVRGYGAPAVLIAAVCISMAQLAGEYWLLGETGHKLKPFAEPMWERFRRTVLWDWDPFGPRDRQALKTGGYLTMAAATLNPIPFTVGRMAAVTIWRSARLPGSTAVIIGCSIIKLISEVRLAFLF